MGNVFQLIIEASFLVQLVMLVLLLFSIYSWSIIVSKHKFLKKVISETQRFEERFWSGIDVAEYYDKIKNKRSIIAIEGIFVSGFREYVKLHEFDIVNSDSILQTSFKSMKIRISREAENLESFLTILATIGTTSPYVGLLGTVWGIMHSFQALSISSQNTIAQVAPGISEALIATALGLIAAIPAVIAYNKFTNDIDKIILKYDNFAEEFTVLLQKRALSEPRKK
mgnify:FL=1|tara:strand:+ start:2167 stop:2844 length:678 start_codon:yes stop_codon:yes gene_type:complete